MKTRRSRNTFGSGDVAKVHPGVARSTCGSEHVQNTSGSDHFFEVEMLKKCTPLWCEAHFESKCTKHTILGRLLEVEMLKSAHRCGAKQIASQNIKITTRSGHCWKLRCRKSARCCGAKHIISQNGKITTCSGHLWTSRCRPDVEKGHTVVARSTFPSQRC